MKNTRGLEEMLFLIESNELEKELTKRNLTVLEKYSCTDITIDDLIYLIEDVYRDDVKDYESNNEDKGDGTEPKNEESIRETEEIKNRLEIISYKHLIFERMVRYNIIDHVNKRVKKKIDICAQINGKDDQHDTYVENDVFEKNRILIFCINGILLCK